MTKERIELLLSAYKHVDGHLVDCVEIGPYHTDEVYCMLEAYIAHKWGLDGEE
jgi:hypothetical protein